MHTILICTANEANNVSLESLDTEGKAIQRLLNSATRKNYDVVLVPNATTEDIINELNVPNRTIEFLHYAGHANGTSLGFNDTAASAQALANKLKSVGTLRCVFINGCSSKGQVQFFHDAGIPFVIATSRPIEDKRAAWFAKQVFHYLTIGKGIKAAVNETKMDATFQKLNIPFINNDRAIGSVTEIQTDEIPWALYLTDINDRVDYTLPFKEKIQEQNAEWLTSNFLNKLISILATLKSDTFQSSRDLLASIRNRSAEQETKIAHLLDILPYSIGERIRQIINPKQNSNNDRELLNDYTFFFETLLHYASSILMSELWQIESILLATKPNNFEKTMGFWESNILENSPYEYKFFLESVIQWFSVFETQSPFKKEDSEKLLDYLNSDSFKDASDFFFRLKKQSTEKSRLSNDELVETSLIAQEHIVKAFSFLKFLAQFNNISVRSIKVTNFRHVKPTFENTISLLKVKGATPIALANEKMLENETVLCTDSPLVNARAVFNLHDTINLFPFIIDRNVFAEENNKVVDIYMFVGYFADKSGNKRYHFARVEDQRKIWQFYVSDQLEPVSLFHIDELTEMCKETEDDKLFDVEDSYLSNQGNKAQNKWQQRNKHTMVREGDFDSYLSEFKKTFLTA